MAERTKLLPKTARAERRSGFFGDTILITAADDDGRMMDICYLNPLLKSEHAMKIAEVMAEAIRNL